jgi:hypothetical protein
LLPTAYSKFFPIGSASATTGPWTCPLPGSFLARRPSLRVCEVVPTSPPLFDRWLGLRDPVMASDAWRGLSSPTRQCVTQGRRNGVASPMPSAYGCLNPLIVGGRPHLSMWDDGPRPGARRVFNDGLPYCRSLPPVGQHGVADGSETTKGPKMDSERRPRLLVRLLCCSGG